MEEFSGLRAAYGHLDLLIRRELLRLRVRYDLPEDDFRGLSVCDAQLEALLRGDRLNPGVQALSFEIRQERAGAVAALQADARWGRLAQAFDLSPFEILTLFCAFAPLAQQKYGSLYSVLNEDVALRGLTVGLAMRLGAEAEGVCRSALLGSRRLRRWGLIHAEPVGRCEGALDLELWPTDPVACFLLGGQVPRHLPGYRLDDDASADPSALPMPEGLADALAGDLTSRPVALVGPAGSGRRFLLRAGLAGRGLSAASLDLARLTGADAPARALRDALLCVRLSGAAAVVEGIESARAHEALDELQGCRIPMVMVGSRIDAMRAFLPQAAMFTMPDPTAAVRHRLWAFHLRRAGLSVPPCDVQEVADLFALPFAGIRSATDAIAGTGNIRPDAETLKAAARACSASAIGARAQRVKDGYVLADLVLPQVLSERLGDFIAATRHRSRVYDDWGMARRLGAARGLAALFTGTSGTGKTMAASVIAKELGLDLFRVELSGVVSKYIGETEKNLDAVFDAARGANCILFFDEADALFGKRSEVKDAHDRYANIECAYLLQKMEQHDGVVILTTNMPRSLDAAFSRRIQFVIDFPRPDAALRERLWRGMFPPEAPLGADVDFALLARSFELSGGEIRNVALDAALGAAGQSEPVITMGSLLKGVERQMVKQGRAPTVAALRPTRGGSAPRNGTGGANEYQSRSCL